MAVSKFQSIEAIQELYDLGVRHFGESRLQEAQGKIEVLPKDIVWHFIGPLQSNKAKKVAQLFSVIHTLDSEAQLKEILKQERVVDAFIEVNIANEVQKHGVPANSLDHFLQLALHCKQVRYRGLMTIGPADEESANTRGYFKSLRELNQVFKGDWLSMGMSGDFEIAVQEGASHIRVGTALFGAR